MIRSIRLRLALWYSAAMVLGLGAAGVGGYLYLRRIMSAQIDAELRNVATAFAQLWLAALQRRGAAPEQFLAESRANNLEFVVFDEHQQELASNSRDVRLRRSRRNGTTGSPADSEISRPDLARLFEAAGANGESFETLEGPLGTERAYGVAVGRPGERQIVAVIRGLEDEEQFLARLRHTFRLVLPLAAGLAVAGGAWLAGRALQPVGAMAKQADRIGAATLHERLPIANTHDEFGHLAGTFNQLLDRVENAFDQQRRFMAEASHELRTPLAVVRGEADLALSQPNRPEARYREALGVIAGESRRLGQIVDDLFLLARSDAGQLTIDTKRLDLGDLAADSARALQTIASGRRTAIDVETTGPAPIVGDPALLRRLIDNVVSNAVKYGREEGRVRLRVSRENGTAVLTVTDDGPGVPAEARQRIFDRFFRAAGARRHDDGEAGGGLGLAIARGIAEAHRGSITLGASAPGETTFRIALPAAGLVEPAADGD
ncbi:MAG: ATP-binding protein [Gemmatimonadales bacterium]